MHVFYINYYALWFVSIIGCLFHRWNVLSEHYFLLCKLNEMCSYYKILFLYDILTVRTYQEVQTEPDIGQ